MAQKPVLSLVEYEKIDRINAEFAEHVMGWLAVGQRSVYNSNMNRDTKTWQGAPSRTSKLEDVPRYWQSLEVAWSGFDTLHDHIEINVQKKHGSWLCEVITNESPYEVRGNGETPSQAIVRCLLKLAGHPLPEPE